MAIIRRFVEDHVCREGCGKPTNNGSDFVSSHDTKLAGEIKKELGEITDAQWAAILEAHYLGWLDAGPSTWNRGRQIVEAAGGRDAFLEVRLRERMERKGTL